METEALIALGETLRQDFQALIEPYATDWLDDAYLTTQDLSEFRTIEVELYWIAWIGYKFATLEAWLTSGFVPVDLAEGNHQPGEPALETHTLPDFRRLKDFENSDPTFIYPTENWPRRDQPPQARSALKGGRAEVAASHPPGGLESHSPVKGLKDLARLLDADHHAEGASMSEVPPNPGAPGDFMRLSRLGEMSLPEDQEAMSQSLAYSRAASAEYSFSRPFPEATEVEESAPPALRKDTDPQKKGKVNFSRPNSTGLERPSLVNPDQNRGLTPPLSTDLDSLGFMERQDLPAPGGPSFEMQPVTSRDISWWNHLPSGHPAPDTFFNDQEHAGGPEFQIEADLGQGQVPGEVSELDLDLILEAIAREIQQEYKRFYGS